MTKSKFWDQLVPHIAAGKTVVASADEVDCSHSVAYRITSDPDFKKDVSEFRTASLQQAVGALGAAATKAIQTLVSITDDVEAKHSDRINASKAILATLQPFTELHELRERLDKLEKQQLRVVS